MRIQPSISFFAGKLVTAFQLNRYLSGDSNEFRFIFSSSSKFDTVFKNMNWSCKNQCQMFDVGHHSARVW